MTTSNAGSTGGAGPTAAPVNDPMSSTSGTQKMTDPYKKPKK